MGDNEYILSVLYMYIYIFYKIYFQFCFVRIFLIFINYDILNLSKNLNYFYYLQEVSYSYFDFNII